jgi:hypothetical protein
VRTRCVIRGAAARRRRALPHARLQAGRAAPRRPSSRSGAPSRSFSTRRCP